MSITELEAQIGTHDGNPILLELSDPYSNVQIDGDNWQHFVTTIVNDLIDNYGSNEVQFITTSSETSNIVNSNPDAMLDYVISASWSESNLDDAIYEINQRRELIKRSGEIGYADYRLAGNELPRVIILVEDEDATILQDLAEKGSYAGIHIIVCNASLDDELKFDKGATNIELKPDNKAYLFNPMYPREDIDLI